MFELSEEKVELLELQEKGIKRINEIYREYLDDENDKYPELVSLLMAYAAVCSRKRDGVYLLEINIFDKKDQIEVVLPAIEKRNTLEIATQRFKSLLRCNLSNENIRIIYQNVLNILM